METQSESRFFVRLWLDNSIRTMADVKGAFKLLFWYIGRITVEYATDSEVRCGGVYGLIPLTDFNIARDIASMGSSCTVDQVYKWRHTLALRGYITCKRTPVGQRTFVIGSEKFPEDRLHPLPSWARDIVGKAIVKRYGDSVKTAESDAQNCTPFCRNGLPSRQNDEPFRQNDGINIREEIETETETESDQPAGAAVTSDDAASRLAGLFRQKTGKALGSTFQQRADIEALVRQDGEEAVVGAFTEWLTRVQGMRGIMWPLAVFASEYAIYSRAAVQQTKPAPKSITTQEQNELDAKRKARVNDLMGALMQCPCPGCNSSGSLTKFIGDSLVCSVCHKDLDVGIFPDRAQRYIDSCRNSSSSKRR